MKATCCAAAAVLVFSAASCKHKSEVTDSEPVTISFTFSDMTSLDNGTESRYYNVGTSVDTVEISGVANRELYLVRMNASTKTTVRPTLLTGATARSAAEPQTPEVPSFSEQPAGIQHFSDPLNYRDLLHTTSTGSAKSRSAYDFSASEQGGGSVSYPEEKLFWINTNLDADFSSEVWTEITCTKKAETDHCVVYVDTEFLGQNTTDHEDGKVTVSDLESLATEFDNLYGFMTGIFGSEYSTDTSTLYPNLIANKEKITILVHDINCDLQTTQTTKSGIAGMFWQKDLIKDEYTQRSKVRSNNDEMFYIDCFFLDYNIKETYSTLAHEFQHMLLCVNKEFPTHLYSSNWYNEMLSMVAEDLLIKHFETTFGVYDEESNPDGFNRYYDSSWNRIPMLNQYYYASGVTDWMDGNDVLLSYASAYGFGAWLARNFGGVELIKKIVSNTFVDESSITKALSDMGYAENFATVFLKYAMSFTQPYATTYTMNREAGSSSYTPLYAHNMWNWVMKLSDGTDYSGPVSVDIQNSSYRYRPWSFVVTDLGNTDSYSTATIELTPSYSSDEKVFLIAR